MSSTDDLSNVPVVPPPPGVTPSLIDGSAGSRGVVILGVAWSLAGIVTVLVLLRIYARCKSLLAKNENDATMWTAFVAYAGGICSIIAVNLAVDSGAGKSIYNTTLIALVSTFKYFYISIVLAAFSNGIAKLSAVLFLLRVQQGSPKYRKYAPLLWFVALSNVAISVATVFITMFQCSPVEKLWNPSVPGTCYVGQNVLLPWNMTQGVWSATSDLLLAIWPILIVRQLSVPRRIKFTLCGLMGIGVLSSIFAYCRIAQWTAIFIASRSGGDINRELTTLILWSQIELWFVLIALGIPPVWPVLKPYVGCCIPPRGQDGGDKYAYGFRYGHRISDRHQPNQPKQVLPAEMGLMSVAEIDGDERVKPVEMSA